MKKLLLSILMLASIATSVNSQTVRNADSSQYKWMFSVGANMVDFRVPGDFGGAAKDYIGFNDVNIYGVPVKVSLERKLSKAFSIQLDGSLNKIKKPFGYAKGDALTDVSFLYIDLKANYDLNNLFGETGFFDPYLSLGGGWNKLGADSTLGIEKQSDVKLNVGYGANLWISDKVGVKIESSYNHAFNHNGTDFFQHSVGLAYRFGRSDRDKDGIDDVDDKCPDVFGIEEFAGCPDTDADGIPDAKDNCPKVKGPKELNGCPDSDGDGIINKDDKCPEEAGEKDNDGCPWGDFDGDKIADNVDKCPKVAGPESNGGCPVVEEVKPQGPDCSVEFNEINATEVFFAFNRVRLKTAAKAKLARVADILKTIKCSVTVLSLRGYADAVGSVQYNLKLSERRSEAVKKYLKSIGVENVDIQGQGFGETESRGAGRNKENRRVEFGIN